MADPTTNPHTSTPPDHDWEWTSNGEYTFADLLKWHEVESSTVLRMTAHYNTGNVYDPHFEWFINQQLWGPLPEGITIYYPSGNGVATWVSDSHHYELKTIADTNKTDVATLLRLTAIHSPDALYAPNMAAYINSCSWEGGGGYLPAGSHVWFPAGH